MSTVLLTECDVPCAKREPVFSSQCRLQKIPSLCRCSRRYRKWHGQSVIFVVSRQRNNISWYVLALWAIPSRSTILNRAPPSRLPLCALLSRVKPRRALWSSHFPGCGSSTQCPVTAKYPSVFDACQASQVRLTSPWTALLYKMSDCAVWVSLEMVTYVEALLETSQLTLKHVHNLLSSCLPIWYGDAVGGACSNVNHVTKWRMLEGLDRLHKLKHQHT